MRWVIVLGIVLVARGLGADEGEAAVLAGWWLPILSAAFVAASAVAAAAIRKAGIKIAEKLSLESTERAALDALTEAVVEVGDTMVAKFKDDSADGKLTKTEVKEAEDAAIDMAWTLAVGPAKEFLLACPVERLKAWIRGILGKIGTTEKRK